MRAGGRVVECLPRRESEPVPPGIHRREGCTRLGDEHWVPPVVRGEHRPERPGRVRARGGEDVPHEWGPIGVTGPGWGGEPGLEHVGGEESAGRGRCGGAGEVEGASGAERFGHEGEPYVYRLRRLYGFGRAAALRGCAAMYFATRSRATAAESTRGWTPSACQAPEGARARTAVLRARPAALTEVVGPRWRGSRAAAWL